MAVLSAFEASMYTLENENGETVMRGSVLSELDHPTRPYVRLFLYVEGQTIEAKVSQGDVPYLAKMFALLSVECDKLLEQHKARYAYSD